MIPDSNLQFIRKKIYEIRSAIMYSMSDELIKIPNNIITVIRVDEEGQVWFLSKRPMQLVNQCEQNFPARLKFFRKGVPYFMDISGKASIAGQAPGVNSTGGITGNTGTGSILLKMKMSNIEYVEQNERRKKKGIEALLENSYKWLLRTLAVPHDSKPALTKLTQSAL